MADLEVQDTTREIVTAGRAGFVSAVVVAAVLAVHPPATTETYSAGEPFLEHVGFFSVVLHLIATAGLLVWPATIAVWGKNLATVEARFAGRVATTTATAAVAIGAVHMIAIDTLAFEFFRPTYAAGGGSEAAAIGLDLLVRIHAASLSAWVVVAFIGLPAALGWASLRDGRMPGWSTPLAFAGAALPVVALVITLNERQWTTMSEMVVFRTGATLLIVWVILTSWRMWRDEAVAVS